MPQNITTKIKNMFFVEQETIWDKTITISFADLHVVNG